MKKLWFLVFLLVPLACVSKGDTNITQGSAKPTCNSVCEDLQAETFGDCKKWTDYNDCIAECEDHSPTDDGLTCVSNASDCDEFQACDSKYDLF